MASKITDLGNGDNQNNKKAIDQDIEQDMEQDTANKPTPLEIAQHMFANEGTGPAWNIEILEVGEGTARLAMILREDMLNGHGTAHGGMLFALADTAFAYACNSRNEMTTAQHASISFLTPGREGERLIADCEEEALKGRSGVYKVMVTGDDDRVIAVFQGLSRALGQQVLQQNGDKNE